MDPGSHQPVRTEPPPMKQVSPSCPKETAMRVITYEDPAVFLAAVEPFLLEDEARHNLHLAISRILVDQPDIYPAYHLWLIEDGGRVIGAALMTPPHHLVLAARPGTASASGRSTHRPSPAAGATPPRWWLHRARTCSPGITGSASSTPTWRTRSRTPSTAGSATASFAPQPRSPLHRPAGSEVSSEP